MLMPDHRVETKFEHRFTRKSDNGKAFGWLKDNFGSEHDDAIINIVRFVYLPIALAEAGASLSEIETEVSKAREYVNEKMMKALGSYSRQESSRSAPSNGVETKFEHRFSRKSDNGKAFGWLKDNFGSECDDAIINIVRFVYLPIALAEAGASLSEIETEVSKAREYVNEKMMKALGSCSRRELNRLAPSNGAVPVPSRNVRPLEIVSAIRDKPNISNGAGSALTPSIAPDNDFLELDEDKFTEG